MTAVDDLAAVQKSIDDNSNFILEGLVLLEQVEAGLRPPSPSGDPAAIAGCAAAYLRAAKDSDTVCDTIRTIHTSSLPAAWQSKVADTAAEDIAALESEVDATTTVLRRAGNALQVWADDLRTAQADDRAGGEALVKIDAAVRKVGPFATPGELSGLRTEAYAAVGLRLAGARLAQTTGRTTATLLYELGQQAHAERAESGAVDALSALVLANEKSGNSLILSSSAMERATQRIAQLSPADRARFQQLLAQAKSPEEAAFLLKALAAGHNVDQVAAFDAAIHPHGDDAAWLNKHLVPDIQGTPDANGHYFGKYGGDTGSGLDTQGYDILDQGGHNDCVAASTVIAQASVDPTVMLHITTGGTAGGDDSPQAVHDRLQQMYLGQYEQGQVADGQNPYPANDGGLGSKGEDKLADQDLGNTTGGNYQYTSMNSDDDRQSAVTHIEHSVDQGKPVPIDITDGKNDAHQVMVIGHDGDRIEIYNPWGYTTWVTESQFVNGDLGPVTSTGSDGSMKTAYGAELPS